MVRLTRSVGNAAMSHTAAVTCVVVDRSRNIRNSVERGGTSKRRVDRKCVSDGQKLWTTRHQLFLWAYSPTRGRLRAVSVSKRARVYRRVARGVFGRIWKNVASRVTS